MFKRNYSGLNKGSQLRPGVMWERRDTDCWRGWGQGRLVYFGVHGPEEVPEAGLHARLPAARRGAT